MTFDDATLMAYADGEGGALDRKRIEHAMARDPAIADRVAAHRAMKDRLRDAFAPVAQAPVPGRLRALVASNVTPLARSPSSAPRSWLTGLAVAASMMLGVGLGAWGWGGGSSPIAVNGGILVASGPLARALDTHLASTSAPPHILTSFRSADGYCRVFASAAADGIACRAGDVWRLRQTRSGNTVEGHDYRQASAADASMLAAAQDMMIGAPLDEAGERRARDGGWR